MVWAVVGGLNGLSSLAPGYYCGSYSRIRRARVSRNWGQWTASKRVKKNCKLFSRSRIPILSLLLSLHIFCWGFLGLSAMRKLLLMLWWFPHHLMTIDIKESMKSFLMMINIDYLLCFSYRLSKQFMRTKCHPVSRVPSNRTYFCQLFILYIKLKGVIPFLFLAIKLILKALNWLFSSSASNYTSLYATWTREQIYNMYSY